MKATIWGIEDGKETTVQCKGVKVTPQLAYLQGCNIEDIDRLIEEGFAMVYEQSGLRLNIKAYLDLENDD